MLRLAASDIYSWLSKDIQQTPTEAEGELCRIQLEQMHVEMGSVLGSNSSILFPLSLQKWIFTRMHDLYVCMWLHSEMYNSLFSKTGWQSGMNNEIYVVKHRLNVKDEFYFITNDLMTFVRICYKF